MINLVLQSAWVLQSAPEWIPKAPVIPDLTGEFLSIIGPYVTYKLGLRYIEYRENRCERALRSLERVDVDRLVREAEECYNDRRGIEEDG